MVSSRYFVFQLNVYQAVKHPHNLDSAKRTQGDYRHIDAKEQRVGPDEDIQNSSRHSAAGCSYQAMINGLIRVAERVLDDTKQRHHLCREAYV